MIESQFSPAVERALLSARIDASSGEMHAARLLVALIDDEEALPAILLAQHGIPWASAREAVQSLSDVKEHVIDEWELVQNARSISRDRDEFPNVTSDTLLLALLRTDIALKNQLEASGLRFGALTTTIIPPPSEIVIEEWEFSEPMEQVRTARILDASANRAREALRVLEDYTRFALDDAFLTTECKRLRHELAQALEQLPRTMLIQSRETLRDVGTQIGTERESERRNPAHVAFVNVKRLQEALRSLEEFGKIIRPEISQTIEQLRYRSYTIERALLIGTTARERLAGTQLYVLLTGSQCLGSLDWTIREAAAGGAQVFQLREKNLDDRLLLERARLVRRWTRDTHTLFIMNDRPDIARLVDADGVHLGQDDLPIKETRQIVGPDALIGVSTHDLNQLRQAIEDGADYVGVGPAFATPTKPGITVAGLDYVRSALAETSLPAFVIGGITPATIDSVVAAGARRIAVSSSIAQAEEPQQVAALFRSALGTIT